MKKILKNINKDQISTQNITWLHKSVYWNFKNISGDVSNICGNVSHISGNMSDINGDVSYIMGNVDDCDISDEERKKWIKIEDLINNNIF